MISYLGTQCPQLTCHQKPVSQGPVRADTPSPMWRPTRAGAGPCRLMSPSTHSSPPPTPRRKTLGVGYSEVGYVHFRFEKFSKVAACSLQPGVSGLGWYPSPILGARATEFGRAGGVEGNLPVLGSAGLLEDSWGSAASGLACCWGVVLGVCLFTPMARFSLGSSH